jgi:small subunit ribosomal protein S1
MSEDQSLVVLAEANPADVASLPEAPSAATLSSEGTVTITDLEPGRQVTGRVKSVTAFGAFVDLGVGPQGLVHISQLARRRVEKVTDVVKVGDEVQVWVKKVDKKRGRISLTMIKPATVHLRDLELDAVVQGVVTRIEPYGVFVDIGTGRDGMVHISELANGYVESPGAVVSVGDRLEAKVIQVDRKARKVNLSTKDFIKTSLPPEPEPEPVPQPEAAADEKLASSMMELAFQASLQRGGSGKRERGLERLIARSLKR